MANANSKNSVYNTKNGRYVLGGTTEVSASKLEWWSRTDVKRDPSDIVYVMEKKYEGKPWLLGYVFYGDEGLTWVILQYNTVLDPLTELVEGKLLLVPTLERVKREVFNPNASVGGIPSTRES